MRMAITPSQAADYRYIGGKTKGKSLSQNRNDAQGGLHGMRDIPRRHVDREAKIDAKSMITKRYTLETSRQAVQDTADRTIITGVIEFA
jgi:Zn-dependent alcohol dehydrogenase